jgi:hypothetical protein
MLMVSDYFLYLTAHFNYYNSAYRAAVAASRVINNLNVVPQDAQRDNIEGQARLLGVEHV